ncbi:hypothetical protein CALCODRAFT_497535 [Calocera cornea HHB12733]|uniref:Complex 1 LYR protein domain-containing protein n=1 Tax=Calocera cornea HHB12733 TaxID=1353952 RepID=A0A165F834_9BASI|nr:hypothetical protein CALCODRAFT_497535 [Calocera cornea HHB12733]
MPPLTTYPPLQRQVFALYRRALRTIHLKPPAQRASWRRFYRFRFRTTTASVGRRDISAVEYLLRQGRRQVDGFADKGVTGVGVGEEQLRWEGERRKLRDWWSATEEQTAV